MLTQSIVHSGIAAALCCTALAPTGAAHAEFPTKPITVVVPFPPGGGGDVISRLLAPKLQAMLKHPIITDNRAGASGNLGTDLVVRAPADGHTLLLHNSTLTINPSIGVKQNFNIRRDLVPLVAVASTPIVIAVHPSLPVKSVAELIDYAKKNPDKLNYSSCGNGTPQHFAGAQFSKVAGITMRHIPYKGCSPAVVDGIGGTVPVLFNTVPNVDAHVKAGKLRYLGVASAKRLGFLADVPTVSETRGMEGFIADVWFGYLAPAKTPKPVLDQLERELLKVMDDKEVQDALTSRLISRTVLNSKQFARQIDSELVNFNRLASEFGVVAD